MAFLEAFGRIRQPLQMRVINSLARGSGVRENFQSEVSRFFELLEQALDTGDPSWLDPLLEEWASSRTETDLEGGERNVMRLINRIITYSVDISRESLPGDEALELLSVLMPIYLYSLERTNTIENQSRIEYISHELKIVQQKLERLDKSKSNFISVAAHELKTPMSLIEGYAAMIGDFVPIEMDQVHMLVNGVHNGVRRLREIVEDMIDISMLDNNLLSLNFQPLWLSRVFILIKADFSTILKNRKQTLILKDFPGSEELIFADQERIYQALKYVIGNAIKYTPNHGTITVDGRILSGFVEIQISDTGIGIAPENLELIFEKFGQLGDVSLHSSGKTKFKGGGPGLGLPIVRGIVKLHGGSIWVESAGNDEITCPGSTFHILLPLRTSPPDHKLARLFGAEDDDNRPPGETGLMV